MPERCHALGCENQPDPRFTAHRREDGHIVVVCENCYRECPATRTEDCICRPVYEPIR